MNLTKFVPIIAKCNQGQRLKGVSDGGKYLYNNVFHNLTNSKPTTIHNIEFDLSNGYQKLYDICSDTFYPLVLGGDHSIGTSTVLSSVKKFGENVTVIWIDAHADINTFESSPSKNIHGIPLACATGLDNIWFDVGSAIDVKLEFNKLIYVGIRDLDPFEKFALNNYNIKHYTVDETIKFINNTTDFIHISFDVDSLDPEILNSTGTMFEDGLTQMDVKKIISKSIETNKLIALDVVEFNPELGNVNKSLDAIKQIFL